MPDASNPSRSASRSILWIRIAAIAPLILIGGAWLLSDTIRGTVNEGVERLWAGDLPGIRQWAEDLGIWAPAVTGVLMVVQAIAAPIPAVMVTASNSFLFGPFWGGLYSVLTANLAAAICYAIGRGYGTLLVDSLVSAESVEKYETFFRRHGMLTVIIARLIPVVPFDPISYVAGMVRMPFWAFFFGTLIGQLPAGMAYSYLVQEIDRPERFIVLLGCLLTALVIAGMLLRRRFLLEPGENR